MPRTKPNFSEFESLFKDMEINVDRENFNKNTVIRIKCKRGHEYTTSITKITCLSHNYKECPYCKKEEKYNRMGISIKTILNHIDQNKYEILNKKEYYNRWTDEIKLLFKENDDIITIKSLNHWEKNNFKVRCPAIKSENILDTDQFFKRVEDITTEKTQEIKNIIPVFNKELSQRSKEKLKGWNVVEYNGTRNKSKFQCKHCGFIKETLIGNLCNCIMCEKKRRKGTVKEKLKKICYEYDIYLKDNTFVKSDQLMTFSCNKCGNDFEKTWAYITGNYYVVNCPHCFRSSKRKSEKELCDFIESLGVEVEYNNRNIISPKELDIFIQSKNIAIEYCGTVWHCEKYKKEKNYHFNKYKSCKNKNIKLITIFDDEWVNKKEICKSRLKNLLGCMNNKIYARKCVIKELSKDQTKNFLNNNHIQGTCQEDYSIGLFHGDTLVSIMCFQNCQERKKQHDWELVRFCNIVNFSVVGAASKLLKHFLNKYTVTLSTFSDNRWSSGDFYETIGFNYSGDLPPNYYYVGNYTKWKLKHRFNFTKQRIVKLFGGDISKTERELTEENGLFRIWDCGYKKYTISR